MKKGRETHNKKVPQKTLAWAGSDQSLLEFEMAQQKMSETTAQDMTLFMEKNATRTNNRLISTVNGVSIITVEGSMTFQTGPEVEFFGLTSYMDIFNAFIDAALDDQTQAIVIKMESGGGTSAGIYQAIEGILQAKTLKPIVCFSSSFIGSAAYFLGCHAEEVYITPLTLAGSIGVRSQLTSYYRRNQDNGIDTQVIRSGEFKALGSADEEITEKVVKYCQDSSDDQYQVFISAVSGQTGIPEATLLDTVAEGREFLGEKAVKVGLVTGISTFTEAVLRAKHLGELQQPQLIKQQPTTTNTLISIPQGIDMKQKEQVTKDTTKNKQPTKNLTVAETGLQASTEKVDKELTAQVAVEQTTIQAAPDTTMQLTQVLEERAVKMSLLGIQVAELNTKLEKQSSDITLLVGVVGEEVTRMSTGLGLSRPNLEGLTVESLVSTMQDMKQTFSTTFPNQQVTTHSLSAGVIDSQSTMADASMEMATALSRLAAIS